MEGIQDLVDAAGSNFVTGEQVPKLAGEEGVLPEVPGFPFAHLGVFNVGLAADDVDFHFLEVGEDGEREVFVPGVAFGLKGVTGTEFFGGFLGFANEAVAAIGAEKIIGARSSKTIPVVHRETQARVLEPLGRRKSSALGIGSETATQAT